MHPSVHAPRQPDRAAVIMGSSGAIVTYRDLERRSNQVAHLLRACELGRGDAIAVMLENIPEVFEIAWGAQRSGLYYTYISSRLSAEEARYIIRDCGAKVFLTQSSLSEVACAIAAEEPGLRLFMVGGAVPPFTGYEAARDAQPETPIADESSGIDMLYSSGTTGRPKGIKYPLPDGPITQSHAITEIAQNRWQLSGDSVFLSPAPLYHSAPLRFSMSTQRLGGTVVVMEKFDAENALKLIERHRVTHAQWVPTHFIRLLKLPEETRRGYDHSSLVKVWHAAAPCPVPVKQGMMAWWGPIIHEFYASTEANGFTEIGPEDWLAHPGSVGRAVYGEFRICDENDEVVPARAEGVIHVENGKPFEYHNDPEKTASAKNRHGWTTVGDIGWVDEEGWLYLTDRKSFMIISGGVNIYPQEIENLLILHPKVGDVAVIGAPDDEMGERVVAVVQPENWADAGPALAAELTEWMQGKLSRVKQPRQIDFERELPRHPTGKLYKRLLRDRYWEAAKRQAG